jgi:hypothetical protein
MVEIFKSPVNLARSVTAVALDETIVSNEITITANSSVRATFAFVNTYEVAPIVVYSIQCADDNFCLTHNILSIDTKDVIIGIENQAFSERTVVIMCTVRARK